jgi:hypothetical protein
MTFIRFAHAENYSDLFICPDEVAAVEIPEKSRSMEECSTVILKNGLRLSVKGSTARVVQRLVEGGEE